MKYNPLVSAQDLRKNLDNPNWKIFDIRGVWGTRPSAIYENYLDGHIPGAIYLDWTKEFIDTSMPIAEAPVADLNGATSSFAALGISAGDTVILCDDYHHLFASRLWWIMRYFGHKNVRVLDGGWHNWQREKLPVSTEVAKPEFGNFVPEEQKNLRITTDEVLHREDSTILIDGRGAANYCGSADNPRSGHIPGAINIPFRSLFDDDSEIFKDEQSIHDLFNEKGIYLYSNMTIISSCGSGYAGSVVLLALSKLGIDAALYDGSFTEWKKDDQRSVEQNLD